VTQKTPSSLGVGEADEARPAPVDAPDAVEPGEPLVGVGVVGGQELRDRPVLAELVLDEQLGLEAIRFDQAVVEVRILVRIGELLRQEPEVQPLRREPTAPLTSPA